MKTQIINNIKNNINNILYFMFSFFATIGIVETYEIGTNANLSNSFLNLIIFILLFFLYKKIKKTTKKETILSICFSIFLSCILVIGTQLEFNGVIAFNFLTAIKIVTLVFALVPMTILLINFINDINLENLKSFNHKKSTLITFAIIFILNFLVLLAIYPGVYGYDAGFQIMQILEKDINITSHYSVIFSYLLANLVQLGKVVFDNYEIGFALFCFMQMTFLSFVTTKITMFATTYTKNTFVYLLSILFFGFFPPYTVMVLSSAQDVIFGGIFALIILNLLELILNHNSYFKNFWRPLELSILIFLLCIFRNNGFYAILVLIPFIVLFQKKKKLTMLICTILPLILFKIYSGPFFDYLGISKGTSIMEMSSIPSQQIARVYNYNYNVFDEKDLKNLNKYYTKLEDFEYYKYRQSISDPIKGVINTKNVENDLSGYIKFWIGLGIKDPKNYIEGFLLNTIGFWYPNKNYNDERMYHPYIEYKMLDAKKYNTRYIELKRESKLPIYDKLLDLTLTKNAWEKVPIISSIFTIGTYFITFVFLIGITIIRKKWNLFIVFAPIIGLYITLFLSPVALLRYCFPIIILLPIFLSIILKKEN